MTKILVVDDELLLRDVLHDYLTRQGYEVVLAGDAEKALESAEKHKPNLALIDIKLPKTSGIELTKQLKSSYPDLCIIIMTGYPSLDTAVNAMQNGAEEYIIKPFRLDELNKTIKKHIVDDNI
ncbi:MAG: response regulator [Candidatus Cloacimonetes bacterium]|jgi:two-component system response regulator FlrC|nr:response regulator [Candidatus Cloacimonadota bacterium]MDD4155075.1 response regulator [Candidatus Cloacimonadota bacterium]